MANRLPENKAWRHQFRPAALRPDPHGAGAQDRETKDTPLSQGLDKALLACTPLAMVTYGLGAAVLHTKACLVCPEP